MKFKDIAAKIGALVSFLVIIGGGALAVNGVKSENYGRFGAGIAIALAGVFFTAACVTFIAHADGDKDFAEWSFSLSVKAAGTFTLFAAFLVFTFVGIYFWIENGFWQLGVAGIVAFVLMIFIAVEWSVRWQTGSVKKVLADPLAEEFTAVISSVKGHMNIQVFGKTFVLFYKYYVNLGDTRSETFLRSKEPLSKTLKAGDKVKIKLNPEKPKYCAIIGKAEEN